MKDDKKKRQAAVVAAAHKWRASDPGSPSGKRKVVPRPNPKDGEPKYMRRMPGAGKSARG